MNIGGPFNNSFTPEDFEFSIFDNFDSSTTEFNIDANFDINNDDLNLDEFLFNEAESKFNDEFSSPNQNNFNKNDSFQLEDLGIFPEKDYIKNSETPLILSTLKNL